MAILFTDLDGTLLTDKKEISPKLQQGLFQMLENGHYLVLTSGRPLNSILEVQEKYNLCHPNVYVIAYNGALIYNAFQSKPIQEHCVTLEDARFILSQAKNQGIHCHTYSDTHIVSELATPELDYYRNHIHLPVAIVADAVSFLSHAPYKLIAISLQGRSVLSAFQNLITPVISKRISPVFSNDNYLEFFSKDAGKGNALISLCEYLNIPLIDSFAIGDEENDISMLNAAATAIAVANASDSVKGYADYITKNSNNHDGLLECLVYYKLI